MLPFCNQVVALSDGTAAVKQQEPKEHKYTPAHATTNANANAATDVVVPSSTSTSTHALASESDISAADDTATKGSTELIDKQPVQKTYSYMDNAKFAAKLYSWRDMCAYIIPTLMQSALQFVLDGYKIEALKANALSDTINSESVLWYLQLDMLIEIINSVYYDVKKFIVGIVSRGDQESNIRSRFIRGIIYAPLSYFEKSNRHHIKSAYDNSTGA
ncbi:hypothetical protein GGH92_009067, partial [Coemansia sp. RSA 2673]